MLELAFIQMGIVSVFYFILSVLLSFGLPPLYRGLELFPGFGLSENIATVQSQFKLILPFIIGLAISFLLVIYVENKIAWLAVSFVSLSGGMRLRRDLLETKGGPLPWFKNGLTLRAPMLVFDIWTIAVSTLLGFMIFVSANS